MNLSLPVYHHKARSLPLLHLCGAARRPSTRVLNTQRRRGRSPDGDGSLWRLAVATCLPRSVDCPNKWTSDEQLLSRTSLLFRETRKKPIVHRVFTYRCLPLASLNLLRSADAGTKEESEDRARPRRPTKSDDLSINTGSTDSC